MSFKEVELSDHIDLLSTAAASSADVSKDAVFAGPPPVVVSLADFIALSEMNGRIGSEFRFKKLAGDKIKDLCNIQ